MQCVFTTFKCALIKFRRTRLRSWSRGSVSTHSHEMENWNETELIYHMSRLGCFDARNAHTPICKNLTNLLIPENESFSGDLAGVNDETKVVMRVAIASYCLAIFLNCVLLWMMYKDPLKRFRTPSALLISNLTISDLLGACFSLAIEGENLRYTSLKHSKFSSDSTTLYLPWLVATTAQSSYYTVILVSFERYFAIAHPFRYRTLVVTKSTLLVVMVSWLLAFAISTPSIFVRELYELTDTGNTIYAINSFILIAIILVLYPLTHASLRRQRKEVLTMNANNKKLRKNKLKIEKNFANTMFLVYFTLLLFTSPYVVTFFFKTTDCNSCLLNNKFLYIWTYFRIFFAVHFGVNPVIYALRLPCYRESLLHMFKKPRRTARTNQPTPSRTGAAKSSTESETQT